MAWSEGNRELRPLNKSVDIAGEKTDWRTVAVALALGVVAALHIGKVPPALPEIRAEMGLDLVGGGFIVSTFNLLGMLLGLVMGRFADQFGRRRTATLGYAFFVLGGGMGALAAGLPVILASRAIEGLGFMAIAVTMPSIVADVVSKRDRPLALGLWSIFMPLGFSIALLVTPVCLSVAGWRLLWGGLAVLSLFSMLLLLPILRVAPQNAAYVPHQRFSDVLGQPCLWLLSAAFGAYVFQWVTLMAWLPTYLSGALGYSLGGASVATALVVAANVPGNLLAGFLMRSGAPPGWLVTIGSTTMAISAAGLFLGTSFAPLIGLGLCLIFSFLGGLIPSVLFSQIPRVSPTPAHASQANGMLMQGSAAGQFAGPPLIGAAVAASGGAWSGAVLPLIAMAVLTTLAGTLATSRQEALELGS